jgi:hypothetical protein
MAESAKRLRPTALRALSLLPRKEACRTGNAGPAIQFPAHHPRGQMATLDRGVSSQAASALQDQLAECRRDCGFYMRRLVAANKVIEELRELARVEDIPLALRDAIEEYDELPVEP